MREPSPPARISTRAIDRAFDVLEALRAEGGSGSVTRLAMRVGLPPSTVHRILRTLADGGYVHEVAGRRYTLGIGLIDLARDAGSSLGDALRPFLPWAVAATGDPVSVAMLDQDEVRYLAREPDDLTIPVFSWVGNRASLHSTAAGKAILSLLTDDEVQALIDRIALPARTPATITDPGELLTHVRRVRVQGYAIDRCEHEEGLVCVAAPVPGPLPIAVSLTGTEARMSVERVRTTCVPVVRALADQLGEACSRLAVGATGAA